MGLSRRDDPYFLTPQGKNNKQNFLFHCLSNGRIAGFLLLMLEIGDHSQIFIEENLFRFFGCNPVFPIAFVEISLIPFKLLDLI